MVYSQWSWNVFATVQCQEHKHYVSHPWQSGMIAPSWHAYLVSMHDKGGISSSSLCFHGVEVSKPFIPRMTSLRHMYHWQQHGTPGFWYTTLSILTTLFQWWDYLPNHDSALQMQLHSRSVWLSVSAKFEGWLVCRSLGCRPQTSRSFRRVASIL